MKLTTNNVCWLMAALILAMAVYASNASAKGLNPDEICPALSSTAASIMKARQSGASMSDMMKIAKDNELIKGLVIDAFRVGRYSTEEFRQRKIEDFRDRVYLECYQELSK